MAYDKNDPAGVSDQAEPAVADTGAEEPLGRHLVEAHFGSAIAGLTLVFVVVKILAVAHADTTTALGIVVESGTASLVVGTLVRTLQSLLAVVFLLLVWLALRRQISPATTIAIRAAGVTVGLALTLVSPVVPAVIVIAAAWVSFDLPGGFRALAWLRGRSREERRRRNLEAAGAQALEALVATATEMEALNAEIDTLAEQLQAARDDQGRPNIAEEGLARLEAATNELAARSAVVTEKADRFGTIYQKVADSFIAQYTRGQAASVRTPKVVLLLAVVLSAFALHGLLSDRPWLPPERIVASGRAPFTGFVLKAGGEGAVVLEDSSRRVVRIDAGDLVSRQFCRTGSAWLNGFWRRPLVALPYSSPSYPACKGLRS